MVLTMISPLVAAALMALLPITAAATAAAFASGPATTSRIQPPNHPAVAEADSRRERTKLGPTKTPLQTRDEELWRAKNRRDGIGTSALGQGEYCCNVWWWWIEIVGMLLGRIGWIGCIVLLDQWWVWVLVPSGWELLHTEF